eukprot:COSAG02_NODE_23550_length_715_cov_1.159091_1_plen_146_part_00
MSSAVNAFYTDGTVSRSAFHRCTARNILTKIFLGSLRLWETHSSTVGSYTAAASLCKRLRALATPPRAKVALLAPQVAEIPTWVPFYAPLFSPFSSVCFVKASYTPPDPYTGRFSVYTHGGALQQNSTIFQYRLHKYCKTKYPVA